MGIHTQKIEPHWNYLIAIERDLERLSRYVEFDQRHFDCFGIEIARLLLACGAEIDVVCKQICQAIAPGSAASKINQYRVEILSLYPEVPMFEVTLPRFGLILHHWDEWEKPNGVPFWWTAYNKTKHERNTQYPRANWKNALNAVAGLFVVVLHLYKEKATLGELVPPPQLLRVGEAHFGGMTMGQYEMGTNYVLEDH